MPASVAHSAFPIRSPVISAMDLTTFSPATTRIPCLSAADVRGWRHTSRPVLSAASLPPVLRSMTNVPPCNGFSTVRLFSASPSMTQVVELVSRMTLKTSEEPDRRTATSCRQIWDTKSKPLRLLQNRRRRTQYTCNAVSNGPRQCCNRVRIFGITPAYRVFDGQTMAKNHSRRSQVDNIQRTISITCCQEPLSS